MHSPIARILARASQKAEAFHRRIHGPKYAPGDVVEFMGIDGRPVAYTLREQLDDNGWIIVTPGRGETVVRNPGRVVRYGGPACG